MKSTGMEDASIKIAQLKESKLLDFLQNANEITKERTSLRSEMDQAFDTFKKKVRNAKQAATNEERAHAMKIDLMKDQMIATEKKRRDLEKKMQEITAVRDNCIKDIESASNEALDIARKQFFDSYVRCSKTLQNFAKQECLRNELVQICLEGGAALVNSRSMNEYKVFLVDRADVDPISISTNLPEDEIKRKTRDAVAILISSTSKIDQISEDISSHVTSPDEDSMNDENVHQNTVSKTTRNDCTITFAVRKSSVLSEMLSAYNDSNDSSMDTTDA